MSLPIGISHRANQTGPWRSGRNFPAGVLLEALVYLPEVQCTPAQISNSESIPP